MRAGIVVTVTRSDRRRLEAIVADRGAAQKHVWRAKIVVATCPYRKFHPVGIGGRIV